MKEVVENWRQSSFTVKEVVQNWRRLQFYCEGSRTTRLKLRARKKMRWAKQMYLPRCVASATTGDPCCWKLETMLNKTCTCMTTGRPTASACASRAHRCQAEKEWAPTQLGPKTLGTSASPVEGNTRRYAHQANRFTQAHTRRYRFTQAHTRRYAHHANRFTQAHTRRYRFTQSHTRRYAHQANRFTQAHTRVWCPQTNSAA